MIAVDPDAILLTVKTWQEIMHYKDNPVRGRRLTLTPPEHPRHAKWSVNKKNAGLKEIKTLQDVKEIFVDAIYRYENNIIDDEKSVCVCGGGGGGGGGGGF